MQGQGLFCFRPGILSCVPIIKVIGVARPDIDASWPGFQALKGEIHNNYERGLSPAGIHFSVPLRADLCRTSPGSSQVLLSESRDERKACHSRAAGFRTLVYAVGYGVRCTEPVL